MMMKTNFFIIIVVLFLPNIYCLSQDNMINSFSPEKRIHDFGEIEEKNGKVSYTFLFTNTTKKPIVITGTRSGCGCISSEFTKGPIKPGENGKVTVTYNPAYRPGVFSKEVVVFYDGGKSYTRVWIKGSVNSFLRPVTEDHPYDFGSGLFCSLKVLPFGTVAKGNSKEIKMFYANDTDKEMELNFMIEGESLDLTFVNPGKLAPKERGSLKFKYTNSQNNKGAKSFNVYPYVNGKKVSISLEVKVTLE